MRQVNKDITKTQLLLLTIYFFSIYTLSGKFYIGEPYTVPQTIVDKSIPFMPWTIWIYLISYAYLFAAIILGRKREEKVKFIQAFLFLTTISSLIFFLFPTTVPRHNFQVPQDAFFLLKLSMKILRILDVPVNCLPSLHVSTAVLSFLFIKKVRKDWALASGVLSVLITLSTMSTKQHHFYDCVGGLMMAVITYFLFIKKIKT